MHENFTLLYVIFGVIFLVLAVSVLPHYQRTSRNTPSLYWLSGILLASLGCFIYAFAPINALFSPLANAISFTSFFCIALLCRSFNQPLPKKALAWSLFSMGVLLVAYVFIVVLNSFAHRVFLTFSVLSALSLWQFRELWVYRRSKPSLQLHLVLVVILVQLVLAWWRAYLLINLEPVNVGISPETDMIATLRWFWIALVIATLMGIGGITLDHLAKFNEQTLHENVRIQALQNQLEINLAEKSQMLDALIFSSKSSNVSLLLSNLTHEIAQPLSAMRLISESVLQDEHMTLQAKERALIQVMKEIDRTIEIVRKSRQFFTGQSVPSGSFDLGDLIFKSLRFFQEDLIKFNILVTPELLNGVMVKANVAQVESALMNLLGHLIDSVKTLSGSKEVAIRMNCQGSQVILNLTSNAQALNSETRNSFFEINSPSTIEFPKFGLWLSRSIVEFHGGAISVQPSDSGRHIQLTLPVFVTSNSS